MDELQGVAGKILKAYSIMNNNKILKTNGTLAKCSINGIEWKYQE
jgi:hypothetical protein